MLPKLSLLFVSLFLLALPLHALSRKKVDKSTDVLMFVPSVAAFVSTLAMDDKEGCKQLVISGATNLAATYTLKYTISKERPDHSNHHAFPSSHSSVVFHGTAFIHKRYGWKVAIPSYCVSAYVGWGRIYAKQHDCIDVLSGAALGAGCAYIFTTPFAKKHNLSVAPTVSPKQYKGVYLSMSF